jgi:hypothetical protein
MPGMILKEHLADNNKQRSSLTIFSWRICVLFFAAPLCCAYRSAVPTELAGYVRNEKYGRADLAVHILRHLPERQSLRIDTGRRSECRVHSRPQSVAGLSFLSTHFMARAGEQYDVPRWGWTWSIMIWEVPPLESESCISRAGKRRVCVLHFVSAARCS